MTIPSSPAPALPPYLLRTEPMEVDDLPLQVSLLTMELAHQRRLVLVMVTALRHALTLIEHERID